MKLEFTEFDKLKNKYLEGDIKNLANKGVLDLAISVFLNWYEYIQDFCESYCNTVPGENAKYFAEIDFLKMLEEHIDRINLLLGFIKSDNLKHSDDILINDKKISIFDDLKKEVQKSFIKLLKYDVDVLKIESKVLIDLQDEINKSIMSIEFKIIEIG
ncbi:unnamed protein product [Candida verbasci]|uniref:Uncharacterized protein n=1 Tax=Candida verbasci TaxID=1227364 RepID=A0A9W4TYX9_9ASCO|nr:unnamed protein product [Candida verbasci]